jgi:hypothetical protein
MQVVQPDVVLVTYDALTSDISQLQPIEWEAIVVDERNSIQPSLSKAHQALRELEANFKLLLSSGNPTKVCFSRVICCQTHGDVALLLAAARDHQAISCILLHLRLSNLLSYNALVTQGDKLNFTHGTVAQDSIEGHVMLHKAKLFFSCLLRLLRQEALVHSFWARRQAAHLQLKADKPVAGIQSCSQVYQSVSLHKHGQLILR